MLMRLDSEQAFTRPLYTLSITGEGTMGFHPSILARSSPARTRGLLWDLRSGRAKLMLPVAMPPPAPQPDQFILGGRSPLAASTIFNYEEPSPPHYHYLNITMDPKANEGIPQTSITAAAARAGAPGSDNAAKKTPEAMVEYLDFLEKLGTVGDISARLVTYFNVFQVSHNEMAEYFRALEIHIIPFLGKYGYEDLKQAIKVSYDTFVDEVSYRINNPAQGNEKVSETYYELVSVIDRVLGKVIGDFSDDEDAGEAASPGGIQDGGGGADEGGVGGKEVGGADAEEKKKENVDTLDLSKLSLGPETPVTKKNRD
ncbi:hypothetical protein TWF751_008737 [Orbilia oligospora]|nr:hypothetical protein TWF751_008737 [Orbilia oligospora]